MAREIKFDIQRNLRIMNKEFIERGFAHAAETSEEIERRNDITVLSKLILVSYNKLHDRVQHLKLKLTLERTEQHKSSNSMILKLTKEWVLIYKVTLLKCTINKKF
jgi:hypothetical protein